MHLGELQRLFRVLPWVLAGDSCLARCKIPCLVRALHHVLAQLPMRVYATFSSVIITTTSTPRKQKRSDKLYRHKIFQRLRKVIWFKIVVCMCVCLCCLYGCFWWHRTLQCCFPLHSIPSWQLSTTHRASTPASLTIDNLRPATVSMFCRKSGRFHGNPLATSLSSDHDCNGLSIIR